MSVGIRAAHNNTDPYVLEDKLLMAFESEALQASLAEGDVIQSLNVSALATPPREPHSLAAACPPHHRPP